MNKEEVLETKWIETVGKTVYLQLKDKIDPNGWLVGKSSLIPIQTLFMFEGRFNDSELRPKSLRGIDDNLGWCKPLVDGLPKKTGEYIFLCPKKIQHTIYISNPLSKLEESHFKNDFTHYKPVKTEPLPLH